jgi:hypothetical protein
MNRRQRRLAQFRPNFYDQLVAQANGQMTGSMKSVPVNYNKIGKHSSGTRNRTLVGKIETNETEQENN